VYARVATFNLDPATADEMIGNVREDVEKGPPPGLEDAKGMMMLVDREKGKSMGIVLFDSEDALKRGDEALNNMNPSGSGNSRTGVDFYEVAVQMLR
jgi:hypothetical protein